MLDPSFSVLVSTFQNSDFTEKLIHLLVILSEEILTGWAYRIKTIWAKSIGNTEMSY